MGLVEQIVKCSDFRAANQASLLVIIYWKENFIIFYWSQLEIPILLVMHEIMLISSLHTLYFLSFHYEILWKVTGLIENPLHLMIAMLRLPTWHHSWWGRLKLVVVLVENIGRLWKCFSLSISVTHVVMTKVWRHVFFFFFFEFIKNCYKKSPDWYKNRIRVVSFRLPTRHCSRWEMKAFKNILYMFIDN
jgi:hypothetical protein